MKAAKEEWTEAQCKNVEKGTTSENCKEAYNTLRALTKAQQHKSAVIKDKSILTESTAVLNRWTEYCSSLHNCEIHPDISLLKNSQTRTQVAESLPALRQEAEEIACNLKVSRSGQLSL